MASLSSHRLQETQAVVSFCAEQFCGNSDGMPGSTSNNIATTLHLLAITTCLAQLSDVPEETQLLPSNMSDMRVTSHKAPGLHI